jgi:hypothetical protein
MLTIPDDYCLIVAMRAEKAAAHVAKITRKHGGKTYVSFLVRRSFRQEGKVKHETLANLSHLPLEVIELVAEALRGEAFVPADKSVRIVATKPHGHVQAVLAMMQRLGIEELLGARPSRERTLVVAMIAERVLFPSSKLAVTRHWHSTTLAEELGVADANVNELYAALDWLGRRQADIERKLAARHLRDGDAVLYDVTSSYYEGATCPLARYGHDRDGKTGRPIIVYGVLGDREGRPVAIEVYPGNTGDPTTVPDQADKLRQRFGLEHIVLVGDRGMLTQTQIDALRQHPGLGWISALRSDAIRQLLETGALERSLFDEVDLAEISSPDFPGERLVACFNPLLADRRRAKRQALLAATEIKLGRLAASVQRRTKKPLSAVAIGLAAGKVVNRYKVAKHFTLSIAEGAFAWQRDQASIEQEQLLDGIYVIRTSEPKRRLSAPDTVRTYKGLAGLERVFRTLKSIDLLVRPIHHRVEPRVKAHLLLCLLAYYVTWHLREAWKPLLFDDEELAANRATRDPVKPPEPSESAQTKRKTRQTALGHPAHSFRTLLQHLAARSRCTCAVATGGTEHTYAQLADADPLQADALRLIEGVARS